MLTNALASGRRQGLSPLPLVIFQLANKSVGLSVLDFDWLKLYLDRHVGGAS